MASRRMPGAPGIVAFALSRIVTKTVSRHCETAATTAFLSHRAKYFFVVARGRTASRDACRILRDVRGRPMFIGSKRIVPHKTFSLIHVFFAQTLYWTWFDACRDSLFP
jgi:hypothetical protein